MAFTKKKVLIVSALQPSNQYSGGGSGVSDSEQFWMRKLAEEIVAELKTTGHDVRLGPAGTPKSTFRENVAWANKATNANADLLISCHSNATAPEGDTRTGIGVYHHPSSAKGRDFAVKLMPFLKPVSASGKVYRSTITVSEVSKTKPPAILVEHEYHDWAGGADWIRTASNRTALAKAYRSYVVAMWGEQSPSSTPSVVYPKTTTLQGRILYFREAGRTTELETALSQYYDKGARWDAPRWRSLVTEWNRLDTNLVLDYGVPKLLKDSPGQVLVVLGSALKADGTMSAKFERRLRLTLDTARAYPSSKIIVSGGAPRNGITEAALGKRWLVDHGIAPLRIVSEAQSGSTVGNARYSMALLKKMNATDYAIISDASHLRRAAVLFEAAQLQLETDVNVRMGLVRNGLIAYKDVSRAEAVPSSSVKFTNSYHTSILLGIRTQYESARKLPPSSA